MDRAVFKDAVYVPEICKLMLGLTIAGPMPEGIEGTRAPYVLEVSVPNADEARQFLERVGLGDIPITCLEAPRPAYSNFVDTQKKPGADFELLARIGGSAVVDDERRGSHPNGFGKDCYSLLENGFCHKCGYQPGDDAPAEDYPWLHGES